MRTLFLPATFAVPATAGSPFPAAEVRCGVQTTLDAPREDLKSLLDSSVAYRF